MSDELRLGKKGENVDLSKIKGGIRRDDIKDEKLKNIFDKYDTDDNDILSSKEAQEFIKDVKASAKNSVFSRLEARRFAKKEIGKGEAKASDVWEFTSTLSRVSDAKDLAGSSVNSAGQEVITYEDGTVETVNKDGSSVIESKDENGRPVFVHKDENGNLIIPDNGIQTVTLSYDEKPGIQAIGNTCPDRNPNAAHGFVSRDSEYIRHGTLSLLAAIDLLTGEAIPLVSETHKSSDFIQFLKKRI